MKYEQPYRFGFHGYSCFSMQLNIKTDLYVILMGKNKLWGRLAPFAMITNLKQQKMYKTDKGHFLQLIFEIFSEIKEDFWTRYWLQPKCFSDI